MRLISELNRYIFLYGLVLLASCSQSPPDIVLINIDDMGWRDVGFMGSKWYETPYIDAIAAEGMVFTDGYASASNCAPSRACLMSGLWTPRHGIFTVASSERGRSKDRKLIPVKNTTTLASEYYTLAEALQDAGYQTCHAGKWHLGPDPTTQGFDVNIGGKTNGSPRSYYPPYGNVELDAPNGEYLTDRIMDSVIGFVEAAGSQPLFLYYSPYAVHTPIHPVDSLRYIYENKEPWNGQGHVEYATMVDNLDRNIGNLLKALKERGRWENTFIVFTSDNGGYYPATRQLPLRSGKGSYYEGGIRVPFVIAWENRIQPGRSDYPVSNLDLYPTLLEAAGLDVLLEGPAALDLDGMSLMPLLVGGRELPLRPLYWHFPHYLQAYDPENDPTRDPLFRTRPGSVIRLGDWKLHQYFEDGGLELYNLAEDISEENNLADELPEKTAELLEKLESWRDRTGAPVPVELNPDYAGTQR